MAMVMASMLSPIPTAFNPIRNPSFPCTQSRTLRSGSDPYPVFRSIKSFAPAAFSNFGPAFSNFGPAFECTEYTVEGLCDTVSVDAAVELGTLSGPAASTLSGGPAAVAVESGDQMVVPFCTEGGALITKLDRVGVRVISTVPF